MITFRLRDNDGNPTGPTYYLDFDALTLEEHRRSANVTQYPVETGATLSDHYQPLPREITLVGIVSDTPTRATVERDGMKNSAAPPTMAVEPLKLQVRPDQRRAGPRGILRPVVTGPLPSRRLIEGNVERARLYTPQWATVLQAQTDANRVQTYMTVLDQLMEQRLPVNVLLYGGREYRDMMITDQRTPRRSGNGSAIEVSLDLTQVIAANPAKIGTAPQQRANASQTAKKQRGNQGVRAAKQKQRSQLNKLLRGGNLQVGGSSLP